MKHISLVKLFVALLVCNIYLFVCCVAGTVGADNTESTPDSGEENRESTGLGTVEFITPDDIILEVPTGGVIPTLSFGTPMLANSPVSSTYSPSELVQNMPGGDDSQTGDSSDKTADSDSTENDNSSENTSEDNGDINIIDTYEAPESTPEEETEISEAVPDTPSEPESSAENTSSSSSSSSTSSSDIPTQPSEDITDNTAANEILKVNDCGEIVSGTALDIVSRITANELGSAFAPEAIKAQAVAAYTYVKYFNERGSTPSVILSDTVSDSTKVLVKSVIGQAVYYNGEIIQAVYSASSAGYTASSEKVWGVDYPYLRSVFCELDKQYDPNYGRKATFTAADMKQRIYNATGITLKGDPSKWFKIVDYAEGFYVGKMEIGGHDTYVDSDGNTVKITGRVFRERVMSFDIRSSAFDIEYDSGADEFTVTTYGYGHGVGMSQNGANNLATYWGYDYKQILEFYYSGAYVQ